MSDSNKSSSKGDLTSISSLVIALLSLFTSISSAAFSYSQTITSHASTRAYLYIKPTMEILVGQDPKMGVEIINGGATPAYNIAFSLRVTGTDSEDGNISDQMVDISGNVKTNQSPFAFKDFSLHELIPLKMAVTKELFDNVTSGKTHVYLAATIKYRDAFNEKHILHFCAPYLGTDVNTILAKSCLAFNDAN